MARGGSYNIGAAAGGPAVMVRIKDVGTLVQQQGGRAGGLAFNLAPGVITGKAYNTLRDKLVEGFQQQGVDADVQVVTSPNVGPPPKSDLGLGIGIGISLTGAIWMLMELARSLKKKK